ncbi:MAG: hypothetical protein JWQ03_477 [Variovorax sp.]|nr:hypothetical protein [Variovorax sp.]
MLPGLGIHGRMRPPPGHALPEGGEAYEVASREAYLAVGITNSAPLSMLSGQRCITDFCLV